MSLVVIKSGHSSGGFLMTMAVTEFDPVDIFFPGREGGGDSVVLCIVIPDTVVKKSLLLLLLFLFFIFANVLQLNILYL